MGYEALETKRPELTEKFKALSAGKLSVKAFHHDLKNSLGSELYAAITERRPYNTWGNVLIQIADLSSRTAGDVMV